MCLVLLGQLILRAEGSRIANGADNLFGNSATSTVGIQRQFAVLDNEAGSTTHNDDQRHNGRGTDTSQTCILDVRHNECSDERGYGGQGQTDLFRYTVLDQVGVGRDTGSYLTSTQLVEVGDVLAQDGLEVVLTDLLSDVFAGVDEANGADVDSNELGNTEVDEVQDILAEIVVELAVGGGTVFDS